MWQKLGEHAGYIFVVRSAKYDVQRRIRSKSAYGLDKLVGRIRVMCTIHDNEGLALKDLKPARPVDACQPLADRVIRNHCALLLEDRDRAQRRSNIHELERT